MTTTLDKNYRITLPEELRGQAGFEAGAPLELTVFGQGVLIVPSTPEHFTKSETKPSAGSRDLKAKSRKRYLEILDELWNSGSDPTMVAPPDLPWDADTPRIPIA